MYKQSITRFAIEIISFAVIYLTGCAVQQDGTKTLLFDELQKGALKIGSGLFEVNAGNNLSAISTIGYADVLGNFLVFYRRQHPDELIIRSEGDVDIDANSKNYKWGLHAIMSYDGFVVANVLDEMGYSNKYVLLSIDTNVIRSVGEIDTAPLAIANGNLSEPFIIDPSNAGILTDRRLRGNTLFYFNENKSFVFQIEGTRVKNIGEADSPFGLRIPTLDGYREAYISDRQLFVHDFGNGSSILLGTTGVQYFSGIDLIPYVSNEGRKCLLDVKNLVSYPDVGHSDTIIGFDNGYYFAIQQEGDPRFDKTDWSFHYSYDGGKTVQQVLVLQDSQMIENVVSENGKLYISAWRLGIVYDIAEKKVVEAYVPENPSPRYGYKWVVNVQPFAGKTYVYLREPYNFPGHD